jgi:O-6-methylguanine DNA methyltransferase
VYVSLFKTELGWFALAGQGSRVTWCSFGHASRAAAEQVARRRFGDSIKSTDWHPTVRRRLCDYAAGRHVTFDDIAIDIDGVPAFRRQVLDVCRSVPYGKTVTYADLASRAGRPLAVRAAGSAMATNPLPILVPCHRVIRSDGGLGGYSCPQGVSLKRRLLDMEAARP